MEQNYYLLLFVSILFTMAITLWIAGHIHSFDASIFNVASNVGKTITLVLGAMACIVVAVALATGMFVIE